MPESVSVPEPFLVMAALLPARIPETVIVRPGFTVQVLTVLLPRVRLPDTELAAVAVKFNAPVEKALMLDEMFKAPVRLMVPLKPQPPFAALAPDTVRFPVPAFTVNAAMPYQLLARELLTSSVIVPLVALVFRVRVPPLLPRRPKSPVIVIFPAVIAVSETNSIPVT